MSEQTHIQTGTEKDTDSYRQPVNASFELFPDTELDLAEEIQRIKSWTETGECIPPTVIGHTLLMPQQLTTFHTTFRTAT